MTTQLAVREIVALHGDPRAQAIWLLCDLGRWDHVKQLIVKEEA